VILIHQRHRQTDGQHAISIPRYALVHRAVKIHHKFSSDLTKRFVTSRCTWSLSDSARFDVLNAKRQPRSRFRLTGVVSIAFPAFPETGCRSKSRKRDGLERNWSSRWLHRSPQRCDWLPDSGWMIDCMGTKVIDVLLVAWYLKAKV